jgi:hypothetical protein
LFDLCVPSVSDGLLQQTFPARLIVGLSPDEKEEYRETLGQDNWRIVSRDGFILLTVDPPYCAIVTADGSPRVAREQFLSALSARGGSVILVDGDPNDPDTIAARLPLDGRTYIRLIFSIRLTADAAGFYASASRWNEKVN